ncbi:MAG: C40 family peptidase [Deltaproteobacteria bacterium]|nr:C40 family peptidase [Deltaproteobacteria bacterium]
MPACHRFLAYCLIALLLACGGPKKDPKRRSDVSGQAGKSCPETTQAPAILPSVRRDQLSADYWIQELSQTVDVDEVVLGVDEIARHNAAVGRRGDTQVFSQNDLAAEIDVSVLENEVAQRLSTMRERISAQQYLNRDGDSLAGKDLNAFTPQKLASILTPSYHVVIDPILIRCGPFNGGLFAPGGDLTYDRNACSAVRTQEVVQRLATWGNGMDLVRTRYALGWIPSNTRLSPEIPQSLRLSYVRAERLRASANTKLKSGDGTSFELPKFASVVLAPHGDRVRFASQNGFHEAPRPASLSSTRRPLTRSSLLRTAFEYINTPYGWGDANGGRDCSRFMLDLFESFDIALPRHSAWQAQAGSFAVDLEPITDEKQKQALLDRAVRNGVALLYLPGHVMLYLGRSGDGVPMALHALGEYVKPCENKAGETVVRVQRVVVSDLQLGRGSSRRSLIERLTKLVVFAKEPGAVFKDIAIHRPAVPPVFPDENKACNDTTNNRIFYSPRYPIAGKPLRLIATSTTKPGARQLGVWDPLGKGVDLVVHELTGPPDTLWVRVDNPSQGTWTAVLGDGEIVFACKRIQVRPSHFVADDKRTDDSVWQPRWAWERDTLNLWAAFVEQLFGFSADDPRTWPNLHEVLRDSDRNLLYDHLGLNEERRLTLQPDCADLPYVLRAYYSWKLRLPYAFRRCSRGTQGHPPTCSSPISNLIARESADEIEAFDYFVNKQVRSGVHSSSGRTHPQDDQTDLYPVGLNRASLTPGAVFADPYGHIMIVVKWYPQQTGKEGSYGILMAAEAQPDGTVGRRRFWRGSFLFEPSTSDVGAGFKHFRPLIYDRQTKEMSALTNEQLARSDQFARFSLQQNQGSRDDFYQTMEALINPLPLDPEKYLLSLIDALDESIRRRVLAVELGERYMEQNNYATMDMPEGLAIFETTGPWEDFATPSRDMRLLISIDTVVEFPDLVGRYPDRFNLTKIDKIEEINTGLRRRLAQELGSRHIEYRKSDGSLQKLSMQQVVDRSVDLEMAYNPNDCIEIRWGASERSKEFSTCKRRANASQKNRMQKYRPWFHTRTRPPRGTPR